RGGAAHRPRARRGAARRLRERAGTDALDLPLAGCGRGGGRAPAGGEGTRGRRARARGAHTRVAFLRGARGRGAAADRRIGGLPDMARGSDRPGRLRTATDRPAPVRELSSGGLVYRPASGSWKVCLGGRRRGHDGALVWSIPKGHVEEGESMVQAALREVREETGLRGEVEDTLGDVTYWYARRDDGGPPRPGPQRV